MAAPRYLVVPINLCDETNETNLEGKAGIWELIKSKIENRKVLKKVG